MAKKVAVLGCGTVGTNLLYLLHKTREHIRKRFGLEIEITKVLVRDPKKPRRTDDFEVPQNLLTTDFSDILKSSPDAVVELMGGLDPAREYVKECLKKGIKVVTANKFLLSEDDEIFFNPLVFFDASVGGGIPIIRTIRHSFPDVPVSIKGILNGTSNFILTQMEMGSDFSSALKKAQELGYAEADPSFDINGTDASHKISILTALLFGLRVKVSSILREGISRLEPIDIEFSRELGYKIKPLAVSELVSETKVKVAVYPAFVPESSSLAQVSGNLNAVSIKGENLGELFLKGQGAGGKPTAVSVLSDLIEALTSAQPPAKTVERKNVELLHPDDYTSEFYIRFYVIDKPGVLAKIADCFGKNNVSIRTVIQKGRAEGGEVPIIIISHECKEVQLKKALEMTLGLDVVTRLPFYIRIENEERQNNP